MSKLVVLLMMFLICSNCIGEGRQEKATRKAIDRLKHIERELLDSANALAVELTVYRINTPAFNVATNKLELLSKDRAWSDIYSRETRTQKNAQSKIESTLKEIKLGLDEARKPVTIVKKAEYEAWARTHPEAAKLKELEQQVESANITAANAHRRAEEANRAAETAQWNAEAANIRAINAENDAQKARRMRDW